MANKKRPVTRRRTSAAEKTPWQPSPKQLEIYEAVHRGDRTQRDIAKQYRVSQPRVSQICKSVEQWLMPQLMEQIRELKTQHTARLQHLYHEAVIAWENSKTDEIVRTESDDGVSVRTRPRTGDAAYLREARAALGDIRDVWGANAPVNVHAVNELRVAGLSIDEAVSAKIGQLQRISGEIRNASDRTD